MIQVGKLHLVQFLVAQEDLARAQICMHHALVMDQLEQVDDLKADIDRFYLGEESWQALLLTFWDSL